MKKLLGIVVLGLIYCNIGYSDNIKLIDCTVKQAPKNTLNFSLNTKSKELSKFDDSGTFGNQKVNYNPGNNSYYTNLETLKHTKGKYKWIVYPDENSVKFEHYSKKEKFISESYWICKNKFVEIAEKPKKQEPKDNDIDYLEILLNNEIVLSEGGKKHTMQFFPNGKMNATYANGETDNDITWVQIDNNGNFEFIYPKGSRFPKTYEKVDFDKMIWHAWGIDIVKKKI